MAGQRFFEKGDSHTARNHPIAQTALKSSQGAIAIALTAQGIDRLYGLRPNGPIRLYLAFDQSIW